jgi:hypothetical protein
MNQISWKKNQSYKNHLNVEYEIIRLNLKIVFLHYGNKQTEKNRRCHPKRFG